MGVCQHHISMCKNSNFEKKIFGYSVTTMDFLLKKNQTKLKRRGIDVWDKGRNTVVKAWLSEEAAIIEGFLRDQNDVLGTVLQSQT